MPFLAPLFVWLGGALASIASWFGTFSLVALGSFLAAAVVPIAKKVLLGLGVGYVVYEGLDTLLEYATTSIQSQVGALPLDLLSLVAWLQIDKMITFVLSAVSIRMTLTLGKQFGLLR